MQVVQNILMLKCLGHNVLKPNEKQAPLFLKNALKDAGVKASDINEVILSAVQQGCL